MRAAHLFFMAAVLMVAPTALAQTDPHAAQAAVQEAAAPPADEATAAADAADAAPAEEAAATPEPQRVCRTIERSESRLRSRRERICRTQAEWDAQQRQGGERSGAERNNN